MQRDLGYRTQLANHMVGEKVIKGTKFGEKDCQIISLHIYPKLLDA